MTEPTLAAMRAAAEQVRAANHTAYDAPRTTDSIHARAGALHDLLVKTEQLIRVFGEHVGAVCDRDGLFSDDDGTPAQHALDACSALLVAANKLDNTAHWVNQAWQDLSHLGEHPDDGPTRGEVGQ